MNIIQDAPINPETRVFVRCSLDVPIIQGEIQEKYRLDSLLETLNFIIKKGGKPIIAGHIGKPNGVYEAELSTTHLLPFFNEVLGQDNFDLLENLRFDSREETDNQEYAKELASKADLYVNESFETSHRKHTSIVSVPKYLPHYAGFRLQKEIEALGKLISSAEKPFIAIVGGVKLESKLPVISKLVKVADKVLLGGKVALSWKDLIPENLTLPIDNIDDKDIGPNTVSIFKEILSTAKTVFWAGPLGMYENDLYFNGTKEIANEIARLTKEKELISVIGGGDTTAAIEKANSIKNYTFVSVGGGAALQYLVDGTLPGIEALN
jgi:phosphoglycerate kinase